MPRVHALPRTSQRRTPPSRAERLLLPGRFLDCSIVVWLETRQEEPMKLHGAALSPFVRKVRIVLAEKNIPYDFDSQVPIADEVLALHPQRKMPILRDGDVVVPDSSVICAYLERTHPSPALYPQDPAEFAKALYLEEYADAHMPESMGAVVFERFVKPNLLQQPTDTVRLQELIGVATERWFGHPKSAGGRAMPSVMDYLESQVPTDRDTIFPRFTVADAAIGAHLGWLAPAGFEIDAKRWPRTARYYRALLDRPSFKSLDR
jgi:glutathione S-transferase